MNLTYYFKYEKNFRIKVLKMIILNSAKKYNSMLKKLNALSSHVILKRELTPYCYCSICGNMEF